MDFSELYQVEEPTTPHSPVKRVLSDGHTGVVKVQAKKDLKGGEEMYRRSTSRMLQLPDSPNVAKVHACYEDDEHFYTVMEEMRGGDLCTFMKHFTKSNPKKFANELRAVIYEILCSISHLHKQGLVHKDVKLENLMFKDEGDEASPSQSRRRRRWLPRCLLVNEAPSSPSRLTLIDFDAVEEWEPGSPRSAVVAGTDGYMAPEAYLGEVSPKTDVFSVGVILYLLVELKFPHAGCPCLTDTHGRLVDRLKLTCPLARPFLTGHPQTVTIGRFLRKLVALHYPFPPKLDNSRMYHHVA